MSDDTLSLREDARASDEQRVARAVAIGLPLVTVTAAGIVGVGIGLATSILVLAAGTLLGVIALLWGSLRILSGDAALPPELEALDMAAQGVDALASRKKMLLRALKDLETERALGKLEDEDFEQISATYREELKAVLRRIDETLAPHRAKAEEAARRHLAKVGLVEAGAQREGDVRDADPTPRTKGLPNREAERVTCPTCGESNERDAKFCKECATKLSAEAKAKSEASEATAPRATSEAPDDT